MSSLPNLSGITGSAPQRSKGQRFSVNWPARMFQKDKIIHRAQIIAVYEKGYTLAFAYALPIGSIVNIEFRALLKDQPHLIRAKAKVDYCLLKSQNNSSEIDLITTQIAREDQHTIRNILQYHEENKR